MHFTVLAGLIITLITAIPVLAMMRNQPRGLFVCFFAEMWERFSYYGMRALLIYYMTQHFLFDDKRAAGQYGSYTTLVYMLPLIGGLVADRWIGTRRAVLFGGVLLVLGHFGMAWEGADNRDYLTYKGAQYEVVAVGREDHRTTRLKVGDKQYDFAFSKAGGLSISGLPANSPIPASLPTGSFGKVTQKANGWAENVFFLSLAFIIMGVGFLKPNISALVGQLYGARDPRRDAGFQLYYFGINMGSFWAAIVCADLGNSFGWSWGFGAAGIGMLAGLFWFILGKPWLEGKGEAPDPIALRRQSGLGLSRQNLIYLAGFAGVGLVYLLVQNHPLVMIVYAIIAVIFLSYVAFNMITKFSKVENLRLGLAMILTLGSVVFWALFEQAGSSLSNFAARNTDLNLLKAPLVFSLFGHSTILGTLTQIQALGPTAAGAWWVDMGFSPSNTQTFNPFFILLFAPVMAGLFNFLSKRHMDPDPVKKFAFALASVGLGFLTLVYAAQYADPAYRVPVFFLVACYFFHTIGELTLSPVGLSQVTKLSPPIMVGTMMAIWFLGTSGGQLAAGLIAQSTATETAGGQVLDGHAALETSLSTFKAIGFAGIGFGVLMFVLSYFVKGWAHGANDYEA